MKEPSQDAIFMIARNIALALKASCEKEAHSIIVKYSFGFVVVEFMNKLAKLGTLRKIQFGKRWDEVYNRVVFSHLNLDQFQASEF